MSFTQFYMDTGGNDMNAGSVQNHAAFAGPSTNGDWGNSAANRFLAAGGATPFTSVTVGMWASIYVDGTTSGAVYVAQVTGVDAGGTYIDLSTTAKYGTAPSNSATGRSCRVGGSWLSELPLVTLTGTVPAATKINFNNNLTITANRSVGLTGTTTAPVWFDGYNATPGDLDADTTNALAKPVWAFNSSFGLTCNAAHQIWSNLTVTGTVSGSVIRPNATSQRYLRLRVTNSSSNAAATAMTVGASNLQFFYCYFKAPATATTSGVVVGSSSAVYVGCVFDTGGLAGFNGTGSGNVTLDGCVCLNNTGAGMLFNTGSNIVVTRCTVYGATADGFKWAGSPGTNCAVIGCLISGLNSSTATTNGINNASGTDTNLIARACNDYYNVTNPEVGMGDSPAFFPQTDSNPVAVSASNLTPVATSAAMIHGFPGIFENETFSGYTNIGAVQTHPPPFGRPGLA